MDAAGNRDLTFENRRNVYSWRYTPPLPWLLIILAILFFIAICVAAFIYYRKRQRRLALERYALKRARRKLKVRCLRRRPYCFLKLRGWVQQGAVLSVGAVAWCRMCPLARVSPPPVPAPSGGQGGRLAQRVRRQEEGQGQGQGQTGWLQQERW